MRKIIGQIKRTLSIVLAVAMVVTCVPQTGMSALAAAEDPDDSSTVMSTDTEDPADLTVPSGTSDDGETGGNDDAGEVDASQEDGVETDDGLTGDEKSEKNPLAEDQTPTDDDNPDESREGSEDVEQVTTYTVTLPSDEKAIVEITGGAEKDGEVYKADGKSNVTFTAEASEGNKVVTVKYTIGGGEAVTVEAQDGVYTIPADAVTGDIVITVETKDVEEGSEETLEDKVTVTFDGNTNKVSIYTVEKNETDGQITYSKSEKPVADNSLAVNQGEELIISVEAADKYKVSGLNADNNVRISRSSVRIDGETVMVYKLTPDADVTVTVKAELDNSKANQAFFRVAEGEINEYYTVTTNGFEGDDTTVRQKVKRVYTARESIQFTLTPDTGYKIDGVTVGGEAVEVTNGENGAVTFEKIFSEDENKVSYEVSVSAIELEADGGKVTFVLSDKAWEGLTLEVSSDDKVVKVADKENEYELKSGAQYVLFTLTRANDKIAPVVEVGNDNASRSWSSIKDGDSYSYKVSASLFTQEGVSVMIDTVPDKRDLIIKSYDIIPEPVLNIDGVEITGEAYSTVDYDTGEECNYIDYTELDVDSAIDLVIVPNNMDDTITSYQINNGEIQIVENNRAEIHFTLENDTTIEINPVDSIVKKTLTVNANPDEVEVMVGEDVYFGEFENGTATRTEKQGTELTLYVTAKAYSGIESYQINDAQAVVPADSQRVTIPITLTDDTTITIKSSHESDQKLYDWEGSDAQEITADSRGVYSVDYYTKDLNEDYGILGRSYTAMVFDKAGEPVKLSAAEITEVGTNAKPASTIAVAVAKDSRFAQLEIVKADAGKRLQVKLWENRDGADNVAAVYDLQVCAEDEPVYAAKITLKAGAKTITTGQQDIKIADVTFDNKATCREIIGVLDNETGANWSPDYASDDGFVKVYAKDNAVYMSVDPNVADGHYDTGILGRHTIRVAAAAESADGVLIAEPAMASITVTVVQGIHELELTVPTNRFYKANNKDASLKTTLTYNNDVKEAAPKAKKVEYSLAEAKWNEDGDVAYTDYVKEGLRVDTKGVIKIEKNYTPDDKEFCVKVKATDFVGNETTAYTEPLKVVSGMQVLKAVYIVEETEEEDGTGYRVVAKGGESLTSGELNDKRVVAVTDAAASIYNVGDLIDINVISQAHSPSYLTYKSNNKALTINQDGRITVNKANPKNNITITVTTNDGGKKSAKLEKLAIKHAQPNLGLRVERLSDYAGVNDVDLYSWIDQLEYKESADKNDTVNISYTASSDSVLRLTVVDTDRDEWDAVSECANFTVAVSGAKVLYKAASPYGQVVTTVIPTKKDVVVTLTDKGNGKRAARYKLTNSGFYTESDRTLKAAGIKTTDKLWANKEEYQGIGYTVTLPAELENFADNYVETAGGKKKQQDELYVMVKTDAADRSIAKKTAAYQSLEAGSNVNGCIPVQNITVAEVKGKKVVTGTFGLDFWDKIAAGSYKLQMIFGTNSNENDETYNEVQPLTKAVAVNLKAVAVKKGTYKPFTGSKMSVKDKTYVDVIGTGKNFIDESYWGLRNVNYSDGRRNIRFTDYFEAVYDENSGSIVGLKLKDGLSDSTLKWLTGSTKDAKAARTAYMEYESYNEDGSMLKSGTTKITVNFTGVVDSDKLTGLKSVNAYAAPGVKIMEGTKIANINITAAKKPASVVHAYAEDMTAQIADDQKLQCVNVWGGGIVLEADNALTQKKHKVTLYVVPEGSYYQEEIGRLAADQSKSAEFAEAIKSKGVKITTTVTVVKKSTGKKITVAKNNLKQKFAVNSDDGMRGYWGPDQNYWIHVPYTTNVEGIMIAGIETDKGVAAAKSNNEIIHFGTNDENDEEQYIDISLTKSDIDKVRNYTVNTKTKEKTVKVKATISFCIPTYNSAVGEIIKDLDPDIRAEEITFNLTLPQKAPEELDTYAEALANVKANKARIEELTPNFWNDMNINLDDEWQGTYYLHEWFWNEDAGEMQRNELFDSVSEAIWMVEEKLREYAPEDSDTVIMMNQYKHADEGEDWIELSVNDFTAPSYKNEGRLVIRAEFNDALSYNRENDTYGVHEEVAFSLVIPAAKEQPTDVETVLNEFIWKAQNGSLVYDLCTNNTESDVIEREARAYTKLRTYRTLRLDIWDFEKELSTVDEEGYISGKLHVYGNRYGGGEVIIPFTFIIPKRNIAVENHKAALDDIIWTCIDRIGEINGIARKDYDSYCNTFTVTIDTSYDNKSIKAEADAWREQNKDNLDLYKNTLAAKLTAVFGDDWEKVSSISVVAEGNVRVINPITGEDKEVDRAISNAKVVKKQEGETIQQFADRFYDQMFENEEEYLEKCNEYLQKYDKDMTVDQIPFSFLHKATGNIKIAVNYTDGAKVSQTYKLNVK